MLPASLAERSTGSRPTSERRRPRRRGQCFAWLRRLLEHYHGAVGNAEDPVLPTSWETGLAIRCKAVAYSWDPQPGMIEVYITDADGHEQRLVEKTVMFYEYESFLPPGPPPLPMDVTRPCYIVSDLGGGRVRIALSQTPDDTYEVLRDSLIVDPQFCRDSC